MKRIFYQTQLFSKKIDHRGGQALLLLIEEEILKNPEAGDLSQDGKKLISQIVAAIKAEV